MEYSAELRNARLAADESTVGTTPILRIRTGTAPATTATADAGTVLVEIDLPSDWQAAPASGAAAKAGSWTATVAATGDAGHWRLYDSGDTLCHMQGSITATGGGGDMTIPSISLTSGNSCAVGTFTRTTGNA